MFQDSFIVVTRVIPERLAELRQVLAEIRADPGRNPWMPFGKCTTVHYARWVVLPEARDAAGRAIPAQLVFATEFDLPLERHLEELVTKGCDGLDRVYACCEGYPGKASVGSFLLAHRVIPEARYQGAQARTREQIDAEAHLRARVEDFVDLRLGGNGGDVPSPQALAAAIVEFVAAQEGLSDLLTPPARAGIGWWLAHHAAAGWRLLKEVPRLPVVLVLPWLLRQEARLGASWSEAAAERIDERTKLHLQMEDVDHQNEMTFVTDVRPDWPWRWTLALVLAWIDFRCRVWDVKGRLGRTFGGGTSSGVPTIHFCQWLTIDEGRRLVFLTNYDGSFEGYLDDFTTFVAAGVNGIWGCSVGYPPTKYLVQLRSGVTSRDIKDFFRHNQVRTDVWYSAYPRLSVMNILDSSSLRTALASAGSGAGAEALLERL